MKTFIIMASLMLCLTSCKIYENGTISITSSADKKSNAFSISHIHLANKQFHFSGLHLNKISTIILKEGSSHFELEIESQNPSSLVANSKANLILAAGKVFEFVLSSSLASATFTIDFSLCDSSLNGKGFDCNILPNDKDILSYDSLTDKWMPANAQGSVTTVTSSPYNINVNQKGNIIIYSGLTSANLNLPPLSSVTETWNITIVRTVAKAVNILLDGADLFSDGSTSLELIGKNIHLIKLMKLGSRWSIIQTSYDCTIGVECWTLDKSGGMKTIYAGHMDGHQYFTTPGGCADSPTPACSGLDDLVVKHWAGQYGTSAYLLVTGATNLFYGKTQSAMLASTYTDTEAASYCENLDYGGYTDWYLPAVQELKLLYDHITAHTGFALGTRYHSSSESVPLGSSNSMWLDFTSGQISSNVKKTPLKVRCVRRF